MHLCISLMSIVSLQHMSVNATASNENINTEKEIETAVT
jgi:hypothetical protein